MSMVTDLTTGRDLRPATRAQSDEAPRDWWQAIRRGFAMRCPHCNEGRIFGRYLKVNDCCPVCGEELHHHRADDAPPYLTIFFVGHVVAAMLMIADERWPDLNMGVHMIIWPSLAIVLCLLLLPRFKGALIAYQWALRMHGFETALPSRART